MEHMEKNFFIILLIITTLLVNILSFWVYINDDAYITFRYSKNLSSGNGPVYNIGERVEGYTDFLWMLILSAGFLFYPAIDIALLGKVIGTLSSLCTLLLMFGITRIIEEMKGEECSCTEETINRNLSYFSLFLISING